MPHSGQLPPQPTFENLREILVAMAKVRPITGCGGPSPDMLDGSDRRRIGRMKVLKVLSRRFKLINVEGTEQYQNLRDGIHPKPTEFQTNMLGSWATVRRGPTPSDPTSVELRQGKWWREKIEARRGSKPMHIQVLVNNGVGCSPCPNFGMGGVNICYVANGLP